MDSDLDQTGIESAPDMPRPTMSRPDILYICDWLPPDFGAVGQYSLLFAEEMAAAGRHVALIGLSSTMPSHEERAVGVGRLTTVRLHTRPYAKARMVERLLWTSRTNTRLLLAARSLAADAESIVFTGSPPLFLHWIAPANALLGKRLVYRITDFHPECSIAERGRSSALLSLMYRITLFWRRRVHEFEVLGHDQAERLREIGIAEDRIHYKPDPTPVAIPPDTEPLPRPAEFAGKHLMLYSGNWGVAHDDRTFIDGYAEHHRHGPGSVVLWLNAVGSRAQAVASALESAGLPFIKGRPVPIDQLAQLLVSADSHLISLSDSFVGFVLPSKVHGCLASGKPIVFIGSPRSDVHRLCIERRATRYRQVAVGDVAGLVEALDWISTVRP